MYYSKPGDLLSLVADQDEAAEVRRLLSKLTAADLDAAQNERDGMARQAWHNAIPGCAGPCDQGRKLCTTPDACLRVAVDDDALCTARGIIIGVACGLAMWAGIAALWGMLR